MTEAEALVAAIRAEHPRNVHPMQTRAKGPAEGAQDLSAGSNHASKGIPQDDSKSPGPKFQYSSPADDPKLVDQVERMIKDSRLGEITLKHLLAISPSIRQRLVSFMRSQRVEVSHIEQELDRSRDNRASLPLREIDVVLNQKVPVKAVIDDGAQIITVREDVWRHLNLPLNPEENMTMESADGSVSYTKGKLKKLPITIGSLTWVVEAQVVAQSPAPMLLGMPFWAATQCRKEVDRNGYMKLTLTLQGKHSETITVSTTPRGSPEPDLDRPSETLFAASGQVTEKIDREALRSLGLLNNPEAHRFFR